jgi:hypothetical protein
MDRRDKDKDGIKCQALDCYFDFIMCNMDPNSPLQEEDNKLDQICEGEPGNIVMFHTTKSQKGDYLYSYNDFL